MSFGFRAQPSFNVLSRAQLLIDSYDQPMGVGGTFFDQLQGGALESYGLGSLVRQGSLPEAAPVDPGLIYEAEDGRDPVLIPDTARHRDAISPRAFERNIRQESPEELQRRRVAAGALSQDEYIASPWYRNNIPYDPGMTRDRAAVLAAWDDAKKVRQFYAEKRPITSFIGNLGGQALDPINYIPVAGPMVRGAAVAKFGRVGGAALAASLDAAGNTALFGLATSGARGQLGDDVSWQALSTDIAMAALIGGAFGTVAGVFGRRSDARFEAQTREQLSTIKNVQEARVALNEAIDGLVTSGEVKLTPNAIDPIARLADELSPRVAIENIARESDLASFERLENLSRTFDINTAEITRLQRLSLDNERFSETRASMIEAERLAERLENAETAITKAASEKEVISSTARRDAIRNELRELVSGIDDSVVREIETIDESLRARRSANEPVTIERDALLKRVDELRADARRSYWSQEAQAFRERPPVDRSPSELDLVSQPALSPSRPTVDISTPRPDTPPEGRQAAEGSLVRAEDYGELSQQYRINPKDGSFIEESDIAQLEIEGRLTEADKEMLAASKDAFDDGVAYGEALKAAVACLI